MILSEEEIIKFLKKNDPKLHKELRLSSNLNRAANLVVKSIRQGWPANSGNPFMDAATARIIKLLAASVN